MDKNKSQSRLELFVGDLSSAGNIDGVGKAARFAFPEGIAVDKDGNIYVSDSIEDRNQGLSNNSIRKITPQGEVSTFVGKSAGFHKPSGLAIDTIGNIYVADHYNHCIRKITPNKVVSTFAGVCRESGYKDGPKDQARFFSPIGIAIDKQGSLYVSDSTNRKLRKISPDGVVSTLAGSDKAYGESKDGTGNSASFIGLMGLNFDSHGVLYVADSRRIRKITPEGVVSALTLKFKEDKPIDFDWFKGLTIDPQDNIYVIDRNAIYKISPKGEVSLFAGERNESSSEDGPGAIAKFYEPESLACDRFGNIFVADSKNMSIRKITPEAVVSTLAGPATQGMIFETKNIDGWHTATQIILDSKGNIFATGRNPISNTINKITPEGVGSLVDFNMGSNIRSLAIDSKDNIYLNENHIGYVAQSGGSGYSPLPRFLRDFLREKSYSRVGKISPTGTFSTVISKTSDHIYDFAVDAEDNIYVATIGQITKITPRTYLPNKTKVLVKFKYDIYPLSRTQGVDGVDREIEHKISSPNSMITDKENNLYFIESSSFTVQKTTKDVTVQKTTKDGRITTSTKKSENGGLYYEIKKITPDGKISIVAGSDKMTGAIDGVGTSASFDFPNNLSIDNRNNLYVLEAKLKTIRRIEPDGKVTTIIGKSGEDKFIEGLLPGGLTKPLSMTVRGNSLYIVMQNGIGVVRSLPY